MELSLDLGSVYVPKTISEYLREVSKVKDSSQKLSKLDDYVKKLEDEMRKIDAFKRELPLCMLLLNDGIWLFFFLSFFLFVIVLILSSRSWVFF